MKTLKRVAKEDLEDGRRYIFKTSQYEKVGRVSGKWFEDVTFAMSTLKACGQFYGPIELEE